MSYKEADGVTSYRGPVVLTNWSFIFGGVKIYLIGQVVGHPSHEDGEKIRTSLVRAAQKPCYVKTKNTLYRVTLQGEEKGQFEDLFQLLCGMRMKPALAKMTG